MTLNLDSVRHLPSKAAYTAKKGRATVKVERADNGGVVIYASCDSLEREVVKYEKLSSYWKNLYNGEVSKQLHQDKKVVYPPAGLVLSVFLFFAIAAVCVLVTIQKYKKL